MNKSPIEIIQSISFKEQLEDNVMKAVQKVGIQIDKEELQRLIDKATPKKPIQTVFNAFCPNCKEALGKQFAIDGINGIMCRQYCSNCGQALDWSEDE